MSTAVVPVSSEDAGMGSVSMGGIRAAAFAKKLKKKSEKVNHDTRNMLISLIPLFLLIGLGAFILQLIEYDTEMESALAFVDQTNSLEDKILDLKERTKATLDLGNLDRIHDPVAPSTSDENEENEDGNNTTEATLDWTMEIRDVICDRNGTKEWLKIPPVRFVVGYFFVLFCAIYIINLCG